MYILNVTELIITLLEGKVDIEVLYDSFILYAIVIAYLIILTKLYYCRVHISITALFFKNIFRFVR